LIYPLIPPLEIYNNRTFHAAQLLDVVVEDVLDFHLIKGRFIPDNDELELEGAVALFSLF
jgi:hypothetical protein